MKGVGASARIWQLADRQPEIPITGISNIYSIVAIIICFSGEIFVFQLAVIYLRSCYDKYTCLLKGLKLTGFYAKIILSVILSKTVCKC